MNEFNYKFFKKTHKLHVRFRYQGSCWKLSWFSFVLIVDLSLFRFRACLFRRLIWWIMVSTVFVSSNYIIKKNLEGKKWWKNWKLTATVERDYYELKSTLIAKVNTDTHEWTIEMDLLVLEPRPLTRHQI